MNTLALVERRGPNRRTKLVPFLAITALFFIIRALGEAHPSVDHYSHMAIACYLGARIFLRGV